MTVEELREKVLRYKAGEYVGRDIEDGYTTEDICIVHTDDLDSLIAAAREEGRAEGAEKVKTNLEAWLLREDNEDVTVTHYTSTYTARHINVQAVIDFLHDRVLAPAPKEEGE